MSPWTSLAEIAREWLDSQDSRERLQVFVNTVLGEVWEDKTEKVDAGNFMSQRENYGPESLPLGVWRLTAGVDVQDDRLEITIAGWGARECWLVEHGILRGDPAEQDVWQTLDWVLSNPFHREDGLELRIKCACVDTGGHHGNEVEAFCKARHRRNVFAVKGVPGTGSIWAERPKTTRRHYRLFSVKVDVCKEAIYNQLRIGGIHFPIADEFNSSYFAQLTAEQVRTKYKNGRPVRDWFLPSHKKNEALDCLAYALAARESMGKIYAPFPRSLAPTQPREPEAVNLQITADQVMSPHGLRRRFR
jgi:phage terminase large subunit GpA-like protein